MRSNRDYLAFGITMSAIFAGILLVAAWQQTVDAFTPLQTGGEPIIVTEKGCDFGFDNNSDDQSDQPFNPAPGEYLPQDTPVLAHCWFQLTTMADADVRLESGLEGWSADAKITRETKQYSYDEKLNVGRPDMLLNLGGHHVDLIMRGRTPSGHDRKEIAKGYEHDLQVPHQFRLIEITVISDARDEEVVFSETVSSASTAFMRAQDAMDKAEKDPAMPPSVLELGGQLLEEGYPQIAERVVELQFPAAGDDASNWKGLPVVWVWVVIAVFIAVIILGLVVWFIRRKPAGWDDD